MTPMPPRFRFLLAAAITATLALLLPAVAATRRNATNIALLRIVSSHTARWSPCGVFAGPPDSVALTVAAAEARLATTASGLRNAGSALLAAGDVEGAAVTFDRALQIDARDPVALMRRAQIYAGDGDPKRSAALLGHVAHADRERLALAGYDRLAAGDPRRAVRCFDVAIEVDPHNAEGFIGKGRVLLQQREAALAFAEFDRAAQLCPRCAVAIFYRAYARLLLREPNDVVTRDFAAAVELAPNDAEILSGWANWLDSTGRREEARSVRRRVRDRS